MTANVVGVNRVCSGQAKGSQGVSLGSRLAGAVFAMAVFGVSLNTYGQPCTSGVSSPPGCTVNGSGAGIATTTNTARHGDNVCFTVSIINACAGCCDVRNLNTNLTMPDDVVVPITVNATVNAPDAFDCPSADPRCVTPSNPVCTGLGTPGYLYVVTHSDEHGDTGVFCPPIPAAGIGQFSAFALGTGQACREIPVGATLCKALAIDVIHGSCCEPCTGVCTEVGTCNECPGNSIFTEDGDCSTSCLLTCGDNDACTTDGVCIPGSGRDNCSPTPGGTPATCGPNNHFCDVPPPAFTCDDANVCTEDVCLDDTDINTPCCENTQIPCPPIPCFRNGGCDPITGCIYIPDCNEGSLAECCPDDGNPCTAEFCDAATGTCGFVPDCTVPADCNDDNVCTTDSCVNFCCVNEEILCPPVVCERNTECDDDDGCQYVDDCRNGPLGTCCPDDGNVCTTEFCDPATGVCGATPDCTSATDCNDNNVCTVDSCANACCTYTPFVCPEIPCKRLVGCDPLAGCQYVDDCRTGALGTCCPDDANPCTEQSCNQTTGLCETAPDCVADADCNDQNACTTDTCDASCCEHEPIICPQQLCNSVTCDPEDGCVYVPISPCCGDGIVEGDETCDPPGSITPEGLVCTDICKFCGDGKLDEGEECEVGIECISHEKPCKNTVCNNQCRCVKENLPNGSIVPTDEECMDLLCFNGMPSEHPKPNGTSCGEAAPGGVCDEPDTCNGQGQCNNNFKEASEVCRPAASECDRPERCSGINPGCPADTCAPAGTLATDDGSECTYDVCNGQCAAIHPPKARGLPCGNGTPTDVCDRPDICDGQGVCDPNRSDFGNECRLTTCAEFVKCLKGPNGGYSPPTCSWADMDGDGDVDLEDHLLHLASH